MLHQMLHAFWQIFTQTSKPVPQSIHVTLHIPQFTFEGHLLHLLKESRHAKNAFCVQLSFPEIWTAFYND
jgi:hypothetical protein